MSRDEQIEQLRAEGFLSVMDNYRQARATPQIEIIRLGDAVSQGPTHPSEWYPEFNIADLYFRPYRG